MGHSILLGHRPRGIDGHSTLCMIESLWGSWSHTSAGARVISASSLPMHCLCFRLALRLSRPVHHVVSHPLPLALPTLHTHSF